MKKITKIFNLFLVLSLAFVFAACNGKKVELSFLEESVELTVGDKQLLEYEVSDSDVKLEWDTDVSGIVDLDQFGYVMALKAGEVKVTVKVEDQDVSASITVTVKDKPVVKPTAVVIENQVEEGKVGESFKLTAKVLPVGAAQEVTWESSNENVATVNASGTVELVGIGTVFISATSKVDETKTVEVEIKVNAPDPESVTISAENAVTEVSVFDTVQFSASTSPDLASNEVEWSVSDTALATINNDGKLTAKQAGTVIVKAVSTVNEEVFDEYEITIVRPEPESITVSGAKEVLEKGEEVSLKASVLPTNALQEVTFSSSNTEVLTVDETGKVVAVGAGTADVVVKAVAKDTVVKTISIKVVDTENMEYSLETILLDANLEGKRFEEIKVDGTDFIIGLNAFTNAKDAFDALEEGSTLVVKAGSYDVAVTIKVDNVVINGPNVGKAAGKDLTNRVDEAVFSKLITLDGVKNVVIDGIAITKQAQIRSTKVVKDITVQNVNSFAPAVPAGEGVIFAQAPTADSVNENYVVKNNRFVDTEGGAPATGYRAVRINNAKDIEITNNYFVGFFDVIRLEGENSAGAGNGTGASGDIIINDNRFENTFQYQIWVGAYHSANMEIKNNYLGVYEGYTSVYGYTYIFGHKAKEGVKSTVNVLNNVVPYRITSWHQFRFDTNGSTNEQLEINVNYNVFHEEPGTSSEGVIYYHIVDHFDSDFVINGENNYYLYDGDVKEEYFKDTTFTPNFRELED